MRMSNTPTGCECGETNEIFNATVDRFQMRLLTRAKDVAIITGRGSGKGQGMGTEWEKGCPSILDRGLHGERYCPRTEIKWMFFSVKMALFEARLGAYKNFHTPDRNIHPCPP